jgi:hypothetical protein
MKKIGHIFLFASRTVVQDIWQLWCGATPTNHAPIRLCPTDSPSVGVPSRMTPDANHFIEILCLLILTSPALSSKAFFASYFCVICKARTLTALLCVQGRRAAWHYNRHIINYFTVTAIDEYWLSLHKNSNVKLLFVSVKIICQTETRDVCRREVDSNSNNDVTNAISCQKCRVRNNC